MPLGRILKNGNRLFGQVAKLLQKNVPQVPFLIQSRPINYVVVNHESVDEMICRFEGIFKNPDADGWDIRQAMNDLAGYDSVPEPCIIIAALHACRRLNDYALSVRFLELVKEKCGDQVNTIYPYIVQEVGPTVAELGCDFPECLGYDKPELYLENVYDM